MNISKKKTSKQHKPIEVKPYQVSFDIKIEAATQNEESKTEVDYPKLGDAISASKRRRNKKEIEQSDKQINAPKVQVRAKEIFKETGKEKITKNSTNNLPAPEKK